MTNIDGGWTAHQGKAGKRYSYILEAIVCIVVLLLQLK